jgi:hypothetical protein
LETIFSTRGGCFPNARARSASLKYCFRLSANFNLPHALRRARSLERSNLRSSVKVLDFFLVSLSLLSLSQVCSEFASTRQISLNSQRLSTPCFAGTATRLDAISIYRMFQALSSTPKRILTRGRGNQISGKANGLLEVGHSKSFWPLVRSNSSRKNASDSVIKDL